ncbi:MAG: ABC transporter ATP-binding protein [Lachnospiraceae bacterium]|nr:ABC transporter ATP-binding protein [Lachnospiraceae bacterium]
MNEHAIDVENVSIYYRILNSTSVRGSVWEKKQRNLVHEAVRNLSFSVDRGEVLGIVGKNGSGKSTLLRSIAGIFSPNAGRIDLHGNTVSLMALGIGFISRLSGRENIVLSGMLLGFSEKDVEDKVQEIIDFSELGDFIDRPVSTYSSGMYSKLAFAITVMLETDIMLVDEVLSVGDNQFQRKSFAKMRELIMNVNTTVIIVSHSMETLRGLCDRILWIHDGAMKEIGDTETILRHYTDFMSR